jgi:prepilin-type N-terminal cleavage/methylation domain-containing protein
MRKPLDKETRRQGDKETPDRLPFSLSPLLLVSPSSSHCRRGYSLVELTVVMTVGATLMGIAVTLLGVLLQAERSGRTHAGQNASLGRLADQFRRDVRAATAPLAAEKNDVGETVWRLDLAAGRSVWYVADEDEIVREERIGRTILRQESYTLPKGSFAAVAADGSAGPSIVRLTIVPTDASLRPGREIRIEAVLGQDRRFAEPYKGRK